MPHLRQMPSGRDGAVTPTCVDLFMELGTTSATQLRSRRNHVERIVSHERSARADSSSTAKQLHQWTRNRRRADSKLQCCNLKEGLWHLPNFWRRRVLPRGKSLAACVGR